jgi:hypothetical protein
METALRYYEEMKMKGYDLDIFSLLHFINFLISHGHASKGCDLLKEVLQKDVHSSNMKMTGFINKAVEELSKDGRISSDIKILVDKYLVSGDQTTHNEDGSK